MTPRPDASLAAAINARFFYGWVMVGVAFVGLFASGAGQSYTISVFVNPLLDELGLSRTAISSAYTLGTLTAAFGLTYVGRLVDRFGARRMLAAVGLLLGAASISFSAIGGLVTLYLVFTAVRIFGQGALMLASMNLVAQWFVRRRGLAMSLANLGFATGSAIYPPLIQWLINRIGWRAAWVWIGGFTWLIVIPPALGLVRDRPEELGARPDGDRGAAPVAGASSEGVAGARTDGAREVEGLPLRAALATPQFWIMAVSNAIPSMLITGMVFHQISYFAEQGLTPQVAANVFTVTALAMVAAGPAFGFLLDRFPTRWILALAQLFMLASMLVMWRAETPLGAGAYGAVFGVALGAMMMMGSYVWAEYFGRRHLGAVQGAAVTISIIGAALGPLPFGLAYDLLGGYREALLLQSLLPAAAAVAVTFCKPPAGRAG